MSYPEDKGETPDATPAGAMPAPSEDHSEAGATPAEQDSPKDTTDEKAPLARALHSERQARRDLEGQVRLLLLKQAEAQQQVANVIRDLETKKLLTSMGLPEELNAQLAEVPTFEARRGILESVNSKISKHFEARVHEEVLKKLETKGPGLHGTGMFKRSPTEPEKGKLPTRKQIGL